VNLSIRTARVEDIDFMVDLYIEAYGYTGPRDILREIFEICLNVSPQGCLLALLGDDVVGMGCVFIYGHVAWIGCMAVKPEYQCRGIGSTILRNLLEIALSHGSRTIRLDSTSAGYNLYRKFGFIEEYYTISYEISKYEPSVDTSKVQVLNYLPQEVIHKDTEIFGADRTKVLETYVNRGAKVLLYNNSYALVYRHRVGPLIASNTEDALVLLSKAYELGARILTIPSANTRAIQLIDKLQARQLYKCIRMRYGPPTNEKIDHIFAILNYAKG